MSPTQRIRKQRGFLIFAATLLVGALVLGMLAGPGLVRAVMRFVAQSRKLSLFVPWQSESPDSLIALYRRAMVEAKSAEARIDGIARESDVLAMLNGAARARGVAIREIQAQDPAGGQAGELPYRLTVQGTFSDLLAFFHEIENRSVVLRHHRVRIKSSFPKSELVAEIELGAIRRR